MLVIFASYIVPLQVLAVPVDLYGNVTHRGNRPAWRNTTIDVLRCTECERAHRRATKIAIFGWLIVLVIVLPFVIIAEAWWIESAISGKVWVIPKGAGLVLVFLPVVIVTVALGFVASKFSWLFLPKGVGRLETAKTFPPVTDLEKRGWVIGSKPRTFGPQRVREEHWIYSRDALNCAQQLLKTGHISDAKALIGKLGGSVSYAETAVIFANPKIVVQVLGEKRAFTSDQELTQWVVREVAPRVSR